MSRDRADRSDTVDRGDPLAQADARMADAKRRFSLAVLATLRGAPDAVAKTREALNAVDAARGELRRLADGATPEGSER